MDITNRIINNPEVKMRETGEVFHFEMGHLRLEIFDMQRVEEKLMTDKLL